MDKKEHLPLFGIGPLLCYPIALLSAMGIILSVKGYIPGTINNSALKNIMTAAGIFLIIEGVLLFFGADINGNLHDNIKRNKLKTNGSYRFVRNPCYCLFLFGCTGSLLIAHNCFLLILPVIFYILMTVILKRTEEIWLTELYGDEYIEYCSRVNRCIPWFQIKR